MLICPMIMLCTHVLWHAIFIIKTGLYQNSIMHATRYGPGMALGMHGKDRSLWSLLIVLVVIRRISFYNEM